MIYEYFVNYFQLFLLVFARIMGMFTSAPFYSGLALDMRFKLSLSFFVSLITVPLLIGMNFNAPKDIVSFGASIISNFVIGLCIGFLVYIVVNAFQLSSQIFSLQMGLGMNEVFDPISDVQVPAIGNILGMMILLLLLRIDGHYYLIQIIVESFKKLNFITNNSLSVLNKGLLSNLTSMLEISLKISLPIIGITLLFDIGMGLISRVAPQFNVMIMGFNVKLIVGFIIIWFLVPIIVEFGDYIIKWVLYQSNQLVNSFS